MIWGMMSFKALSGLHIVPKKTIMNAIYYLDHILSGTCLDAIEFTALTGCVTERSMLENMSDFCSCKMEHLHTPPKLFSNGLQIIFLVFGRKENGL